MELFRIITLLSILLSFVLPSSAAHSQQILVNSSQEQGHDLELTLPRKLRLIEEAKVKAVIERKNRGVRNKQEEALPGKFHEKEAKMVHAKKGTWQEWKEGADSREFFTMDYSHVRRRRPIHNKFTPAVAP